MGWLSRIFGGEPKSREPDRAARPTPALPSGKFGLDRHRPEGKWVQATPLLNVAGLHHRRDQVGSFLSAVAIAERKRAPYGIELRPEPENPHDPNAIRVYGRAGGHEWHIGFIDADTARDVNEDILARGLPIAGEMYSIWRGDDGYIDIKVFVLAPPGNSEKARRKRRQR